MEHHQNPFLRCISAVFYVKKLMETFLPVFKDGLVLLLSYFSSKKIKISLCASQKSKVLVVL